MTVDDRVTLPLSAVRAAAIRMCAGFCDDPWTGDLLPSGHDPACLIPLLVERDAMAAEVYRTTAISGDCMDSVKHGACGGCACHCHTLKTGRMKK